MSLENVALFPKWKENCTPAERLRELALLAEKHPQEWERFVVVRQCFPDPDTVNTRCFKFNAKLTDCLGMIELGKLNLYEDSCGDD